MVSLDEITELSGPLLQGEENEISRRYLRMLERWIPVGVEYYEDWDERPGCGHFLGGCHWYGNETAGPSEAFALASVSPEYDPSVTGVSRADLRRMAIGGVRYLCYTHDTGPEECVRPMNGLGRPENFGRKWGERGRGFFPESQCGDAVAGLARTCMLLREHIDEETLLMVGRVHEDYAGRFGDLDPRSGVYYDTQMEENAWTSLGLTSCYLYLSRHPKAPHWERAARRWMFSTCAAPQDAKDDGPMGNATVRLMAGKTFTALPDYWAENHGMVHPNYTASGVRSLMSVGTQLCLWGKDLPEELFWNRKRIYQNLKLLTDRSGYPQAVQGMDWHYLPACGSEAPHAVASVLFSDADAAALQRRSLRNSELRQEGNGGRLYDKDLALSTCDQQDPMIMREAMIWQVARLYLFHRLFGPGTRPTRDTALEGHLRGVHAFNHAGFVHHRHTAGQTSLSWRNSIMALPLPAGGIYTIAPRKGSWLGNPVVRGNPESHHVESANVQMYEDGFAAALVLQRCQGSLRQEVLAASLPDGRFITFERFVALKKVVLEELSQGLLEVVNEHFPLLGDNSRGARMVHTRRGETEFRGWVGGEGDDVLCELGDGGSLNLDDRVGFRFLGTGEAIYRNRHHFQPYRAVADELLLSHTAGPRGLSKGEVGGWLAAVVIPGQHHSETPRVKLQLAYDRDAVCLMVDGAITAANFGGKRLDCRFNFPRSAEPHIFAGASLVLEDELEYVIPVEPGRAMMSESGLVLSTDGAMRIDVGNDGRTCLTNTGDSSCSVCRVGAEPGWRMAPGETKLLQ